MKEYIITSIDQWNELLEKFQNKNTLTNNYMLPAEIEQYIGDGKLTVTEGENNLYLYLRKATCLRLFYYLNDMSEPLSFDRNQDYVCEIIYRGEVAPDDEINYIKHKGFKQGAIRDLLSLNFKDITSYTLQSGCEIRLANNIEEVADACHLFNDTFDRFSGDFIEETEITSLLEGNHITVAIAENGEIAGAVHHDRVKGTAWGRHLAIRPKFRGRSLGKDLYYDFIYRYNDEGVNRFMHWCVSDNDRAMQMYEHMGFKPAGRKCLSMILNNNNK